MHSLSLYLLTCTVFAVVFGQEFTACPVGTSPCVNGDCVGEGVQGEYTCRCLVGYAGKNCSVLTYQNCGYNLFENTGTLTSPNYPSPYGFRHICHYYVRVHGAKQLTFNVQAFDTEYEKDILQYAPGVQWNISRNTGTILQGNLSNVPEQFTVEGGEVWFVFESDRNVPGPGFLITYAATDPSNCASNLCQNGATCTDQSNGYLCTCPVGYYGTNCEIRIACINKCTNRLKPKCGSDGKTYRNRCYLLNANCLDNSVRMISRKPCPGPGPIAIVGGDRRTCIEGADSSSSDSSIERVRCPPPVPTTAMPPIATTVATTNAATTNVLTTSEATPCRGDLC